MNLSNWQTNVIKNIDDEIDNITEQVKDENRNSRFYKVNEREVAELMDFKLLVEILDKPVFEKMLNQLDSRGKILLNRFNVWAGMYKGVGSVRCAFNKEMGIGTIRRQRRYINKILAFNKNKIKQDEHNHLSTNQTDIQVVAKEGSDRQGNKGRFCRRLYRRQNRQRQRAYT